MKAENPIRAMAVRSAFWLEAARSCWPQSEDTVTAM